jgi:hypothetical protein
LIYFESGLFVQSDHTRCYDFMGYSSAYIYETLGPKRDMTLVNGSTSGLFGLNVSLYEWREHGGYYIMYIPCKPEPVRGLVPPPQPGCTATTEIDHRQQLGWIF